MKVYLKKYVLVFAAALAFSASTNVALAVSNPFKTVFKNCGKRSGWINKLGGSMCTIRPIFDAAYILCGGDALKTTKCGLAASGEADVSSYASMVRLGLNALKLKALANTISEEDFEFSTSRRTSSHWDDKDGDTPIEDFAHYLHNTAGDSKLGKILDKMCEFMDVGSLAADMAGVDLTPLVDGCDAIAEE